MPEAKFKRDCYGSDAVSGLTGRLILVLSVVWHVGFRAGFACFGRAFLRRLSGCCFLVERPGVWLEGWMVFGRWVLCHGRFFDNLIQKKEKRGRQGPAEHRKMFNRYFGGHVSREDVTCVQMVGFCSSNRAFPDGLDVRCIYVLVDSNGLELRL